MRRYEGRYCEQHYKLAYMSVGKNRSLIFCIALAAKQWQRDERVRWSDGIKSIGNVCHLPTFLFCMPTAIPAHIHAPYSTTVVNQFYVSVLWQCSIKLDSIEHIVYCHWHAVRCWKLASSRQLVLRVVLSQSRNKSVTSCCNDVTCRPFNCTQVYLSELSTQSYWLRYCRL